MQKLGGYEAVNIALLSLYYMRRIIACLTVLSIKVTRSKKWADLGRLLGHNGIPGLSTQIKNSYTRVILPYEHFCERVRSSPTLASLTSATRDPQLRTHVNTQTLGKRARPSSSSLPETTEMDSPPSSPLTATSSPLSEPPDETDYKEDVGARMDSLKGKNAEQSNRKSLRFEF